jgi:hypothetical protein
VFGFEKAVMLRLPGFIGDQERSRLLADAAELLQRDEGIPIVVVSFVQ